MKPSTALDILDAAYARDTSDDVWLTRVTRAVRPNLDRGLGVTGYFVRIGGPGEFEGHGHVGPTKVDVLALWNGLIANAGREFLRQIHLGGPFGLSNTPLVLGLRESASALGTLHEHEASGAAGLMGLDSDGEGIAFATWAPGGRSLAAGRGEEAFWNRVAPHLATAARLRRRLRADAQAPAAVLEPGGKLVHAEGGARTRLARAALREATLRLDRAHTRGVGSDAAQTLALWRCMVEKRWTLVDQFERDGRRYVVAYPNLPRTAAAISFLSPREQMVAGAAALGHANKVIAYALDLAESTVATLLSRAARKLGARSRVQLVRMMQGVTLDPQP